MIRLPKLFVLSVAMLLCLLCIATIGHLQSIHAQNAQGTGFTTTFSVGNTNYVAIKANTACRNITVGEDRSAAGWPTADFSVKKPSTGSAARQISAGGTYSFMAQSSFQPGDIVGYVKLVSGSSTFFQDESPT